MSDERIWVLLGQKIGDNNQLLRLAQALGEPFRAIELRYNALHHLPPALLRRSRASLDYRSRVMLAPPWPQLVLGIGNRSVPAALAIRHASNGEAKLVRLGNPRTDPRKFDLVITTPQYSVTDAANVIRLPVGISTAAPAEPSPAEQDWLARLPRPHRLLLIGGDTFMWRLRAAKLAAAAGKLARKPGGGVIVTRSARTKAAVMDRVRRSLEGSDHAVAEGAIPRYSVLLRDADEIYVTADSVAMTSDAIATGKPVGLIFPEKTALGRFFYGLGGRVPVRDISAFWTEIRALRLAGTVDDPVNAGLRIDPLETAVAAVRALA